LLINAQSADKSRQAFPAPFTTAIGLMPQRVRNRANASMKIIDDAELVNAGPNSIRRSSHEVLYLVRWFIRC
jgi:hypothetical protein